mmetsp:Transcript_12495/g.26946  ORF Transcript_12495/g.26946 Transcript_12495/m.26946 type:complete len:224 (-) Transcript_12495:1382-2053(-)
MLAWGLGSWLASWCAVEEWVLVLGQKSVPWWVSSMDLDSVIWTVMLLAKPWDAPSEPMSPHTTPRPPTPLSKAHCSTSSHCLARSHIHRKRRSHTRRQCHSVPPVLPRGRNSQTARTIQDTLPKRVRDSAWADSWMGRGSERTTMEMSMECRSESDSAWRMVSWIFRRRAMRWAIPIGRVFPSCQSERRCRSARRRHRRGRRDNCGTAVTTTTPLQLRYHRTK